MPSVAALTTAASSDFPLLRTRIPIVFGPCSRKLTTPRRDFSNCGLSRMDTSSNICVAKHFNITVQLSPWVSAGHMWKIAGTTRWTLLMAMRFPARGQAIFRINSITAYKRYGLSMVKKLNRAAALWNSFSSSPVRRSSSVISSGGSRHFAVSAQLACLKAAASSVLGVATPRASVSPRTFRARETMLLVWLVLNSPLSQCQCSSQENDCPRL